MRQLTLILFSLLSINTILFSEEVTIHKNLFRTTFETVELPSNIKPMGLIGVNYLRKIDDSNFYFGPGVYGALTGERGGFFSGGLEIGYELPVTENLSLDAGFFAGGGSGAGNEVFGNGLMLRAHAGVNYDLGSYKIGGYYSKVKFPDSKTDSNHLGVQLEIPFETVSTTSTNSDIIFKSLMEKNSKYNFGWQDNHLTVMYQYYNPSAGSFRNTNAKTPLSLVGFEYSKNFNNQYFAYVEASMAGTGNAPGYAEILGGLGYNIPISSDFGFNLKAGVGSAGGGGVDVQGGFLYKLNGGVYYKPTRNVSLEFELGYVDAPEGNFSAINEKIALSYSVPLLTVGKNVRYFANLRDSTTQMWRFRMSAQHYLASNHIRESKKYGSADLMAFKFDRFINDNLYLTGHGFGAFRGDIAGYGGGFMGLGYNTNPFIGNLSAYTEMMLGVGGAGGVDAGEGLLAEANVGLNYNISDSIDFQVSVGRVKALQSGNLNENIIEAGLVYKFRTIEP